MKRRRTFARIMPLWIAIFLPTDWLSNGRLVEITANQLDKLVPGWYKHVRSGLFAINDSKYCVLGQILKRAGLPYEDLTYFWTWLEGKMLWRFIHEKAARALYLDEHHNTWLGYGTGVGNKNALPAFVTELNLLWRVEMRNRKT